MGDFSPYQVKTRDLVRTLVEASGEHGIKASMVDFDLLSYESYYKNHNTQEWKLFNRAESPFIVEATALENSKQEFFQEYVISVKPLRKDDSNLDLIIKLSANKSKSKVIVKVSKASTIIYAHDSAVKIKDIIYKKLLRLSFLIDIFDSDLDVQILDLLDIIKDKGSLDKDFTITACEALNPKDSIDDHIIYNYFDETNKELFTPVSADECVVTYVKPVRGVSGRGCNGKFIEALSPTEKHAKYLRIKDDSLRKEDEELEIKYYANIDGFITNEEGALSVGKDLSVKKISFKETGSVSGDLDKDVSINVQKTDSHEDAIGAGLKVEAKDVTIDGTVGSGAIVHAETVNIKAQTHKESTLIVTDTATIYLHRGKLTSKIAKINILESGIIDADDIDIELMVGGEVRGRVIHVKEVKSNSLLIASERIVVDHISGEGNKFIIDPSSIDEFSSEVKEQITEIDAVKKDMKIIHDTQLKLQQIFKALSSNVKVFQQNIARAKKNKMKPNPVDIGKLLKFKKSGELIKESAEKKAVLVEKLEVMNAKLEELYAAELNSEVIHNGTYRNNARVTFIDPKTKEEYSTFPNSKITKISLEESEDGESKKLVFK
ncbi:MAG: hypothetical protein GQ570_06895 [Helicobacteraceae bacterium]|nr:hypothetical protein [Helicobacteraceae bacterium]